LHEEGGHDEEEDDQQVFDEFPHQEIIADDPVPMRDHIDDHQEK
jgi:hypothetical protein